ncbi:MAG: hypothetical protein N2510_02640 [Ignavibacteria bacterium]|nr:hypothetical protein [Ignavibacteria bacterium]
MRISIYLIFYSLILLPQALEAQLQSGTGPLKWITWTLLQTIPSPGYYEDRNESSSSLKFGLSWNIIPVSYSFGANEYLPPLSFFHIKPSKRFSGSAEIFFEPSYITGNFKYSTIGKFHWKTGGRIILPIAHKGEYLSVSVGMGYYNQKSSLNNKKYSGVFLEGVVYTFFGMLGLKLSYSHNAQSRYYLGLYFKYY